MRVGRSQETSWMGADARSSGRHKGSGPPYLRYGRPQEPYTPSARRQQAIYAGRPVRSKLYIFNGGAEGDRTLDLMTASHVILQFLATT